MNKNLFDTCSESVQSAVEYVNSNSDEIEFRPSNAPAFYLLDRVESDVVKQFIESWADLDFSLFELTMERPLSVVNLFKLERQYNPNSWKSQPKVRDIAESLKNKQRVSGRIQTNELPHSGPLWALLQYEPHSIATQNAIRYLKSKIESKEWMNSYQGTQRLAAGALALCEAGFYEHEQSLRSIGKQLETNLDDFIETEVDKENTFPSYQEAACVLMAFSKLPKSHTHSSQIIVQNLKGNQNEDGYWFGEQFVRESAMIALGLISAGEGPRISAHEVEWQRTLNEQARRRSRPQFVSTFPAKAGATSTAEIYERSKSLIVSTRHELRVGSLFIDMLYDEILDLTREHPEIDVKMLTRGRNTTGNRQRIQKAVLDELIEATDGNVRENHRLHCRLVVSDDDAMMISSADLTRDQLRDQFNAGVYTSDPTAITETIEFFDEIWEESERIEHS